MRNDDPSNTGDLLGAMALDEDWVIINQMIKYYKFGFTTDYLNLDLRLGHITREKAIKIIEKYDGACSKPTFNLFAITLIYLKKNFGA